MDAATGLTSCESWCVCALKGERKREIRESRPIDRIINPVRARGREILESWRPLPFYLRLFSFEKKGRGSEIT